MAIYKVPKSKKDKLVLFCKDVLYFFGGVLATAILAAILIALPYLVFFLWNEVLVPLFHANQFFHNLMIYLGSLMICALISKK